MGQGCKLKNDRGPEERPTNWARSVLGQGGNLGADVSGDDAVKGEVVMTSSEMDRPSVYTHQVPIT
jgi:hypothetical protein